MGIGIGTVVGLIATGSIIIAPIAGITTGVIGYKMIKIKLLLSTT